MTETNLAKGGDTGLNMSINNPRLRIILKNRLATRGFTLTELVVIVVTVAAIAGLLLPALAGSQSGSQQLGCLNNVRRLNMVFQLYSADNDGKIVANNAGAGGGAAWVEGNFSTIPSDATNFVILNDPRASLFARYIPVSDIKIYRCPSDNMKGTGAGTVAAPRVRSYAMNSFMGWEGPVYHNQGDPNGLYRVFNRLRQITGLTKNSKQALSPTTAFTFQDVQPYSICRPFFGMFFDHNAWFHHPATFHDGSSSIGFADAHVESHRWRMPSTVPSTALTGNPPQHLGAHDYPMPSSQTDDIFWLQDHTSGKK